MYMCTYIHMSVVTECMYMSMYEKVCITMVTVVLSTHPLMSVISRVLLVHTYSTVGLRVPI